MRSSWPTQSDEAAWREPANYALQLETSDVDEAESEAWAATMRDLLSRSLPYDEITALRLEVLSARVRGRKLDQTNLPLQVRI